MEIVKDIALREEGILLVNFMPTPYDVPAWPLIRKLADYIKENINEVSPPPWAYFVKTGSHNERPPEQEDFWYIRSASLLRKLYLHGVIGIERLRSEYGGRTRHKMRPEHFRKAGGSIIRKILQQLEKAGLVATIKGRGRVLTKRGKELLENISAEVKKELEETIPELKKYG